MVANTLAAIPSAVPLAVSGSIWAAIGCGRGALFPFDARMCIKFRMPPAALAGARRKMHVPHTRDGTYTHPFADLVHI